MYSIERGDCLLLANISNGQLKTGKTLLGQMSHPLNSGNIPDGFRFGENPHEKDGQSCLA